ncbi:hypothetical protein BGZ65_009348, partial [Modicella reniformis]
MAANASKNKATTANRTSRTTTAPTTTTTPTPTPTLAPAPAPTPTTAYVGNNRASGTSGTATAQLTMDGYKVHASALATSARAPAQNMTAVAATQRAAALAADDATNLADASASAQDPSSPKASRCSFCGVIWCLFQPLMPIGFVVMMGYIYYVYIFLVCFDYIFQVLQKPLQA